MSNTKTRIVEKSITLFNKHGYSNVSLHQIANALSLSSGNLTYHFPKKASLMDAVYTTFTEELLSLQTGLGSKSNVKEMITELRAFIKFQKRFLFFYVDLLDIGRNYPAIAKRHYKHIEGQIKRIKDNLVYNFESGIIKEKNKKDLDILAETIWTTVVFYPSQMILRGKNISNSNLIEIVISILRPYLKSEYQYLLDKSKENISTDIIN